MGKERDAAEATIQTIRRQTRRMRSAEDQVRSVMEGLRGEDTIKEVWRREGISESLYSKWSKEFRAAGKAQPAGDTQRQATSSDVADLRQENERLKQAVAELLRQNRVLKKVWLAGRTGGTTDALHTGGEDGSHPAGGNSRVIRQTNAG